MDGLDNFLPILYNVDMFDITTGRSREMAVAAKQMQAAVVPDLIGLYGRVMARALKVSLESLDRELTMHEQGFRSDEREESIMRWTKTSKAAADALRATGRG